jgi:hypothetical protein
LPESQRWSAAPHRSIIGCIPIKEICCGRRNQREILIRFPTLAYLYPEFRIVAVLGISKVRATHFIRQDLDLASQELSILVTIAEFACLRVVDSECFIEDMRESSWVVFRELEDLLLALSKTTLEYRLKEVDSIAKKLLWQHPQLAVWGQRRF